MGATRVGPRVQSAGTWQHGGFEPPARHCAAQPGGVSYQKEKPMLELMPGIEIALYLISWAAATVGALTLWDWANNPQGDDQ